MKRKRITAKISKIELINRVSCAELVFAPKRLIDPVDFTCGTELEAAEKAATIPAYAGFSEGISINKSKLRPFAYLKDEVFVPRSSSAYTSKGARNPR